MRAARAALVALVLAGAFALCAAYDITGRAILTDNQIFFYLSERAAAGVPPHISMADPKTQLSALVNAVAIVVGDSLGFQPIATFRAFSVATVLLAVWLAYRLATLLSGRVLGGAVAAACLFVVEGLFLEGTSGGRPHVFAATAILGAHVLMARRYDFASGFVAACALLCWQPAAIVLGSIGLAVLLSREAPLRRAVTVTLGALTAGALYESYFLWHGVAAEQLFQEFVLPTGSIHVIESWAENFWFVMTDARAYRAQPRLLPVMFVLVVALRWLSALVRPRTVLETVRARPEVTAFWIAAHLGFAFTVYEHQAHPDLLLVQPYFAVACGWMFADLFCWGSPGRVRLVAGWAVASVLLGWGFLQGRMMAQLTGPGATYSLSDQLALADAMRIYYDHRRSVWVLGPVHFLALLRQDNWAPYAFFWDDLDRHMNTDAYRPLKDGKMPQIIVTGRGIVPGQAGWRRAEYQEITPPRFGPHNVRIFARRMDADAIAEEAAKAPPKPPKNPAEPATASPVPASQGENGK